MMKAIYTVRHGAAENAFEFREVPKPTPKAGELLIREEGFGLNFADVMARRGLYRDAPPLPSVVGYDVCGRVEEIGSGVEGFAVGDRVTAMTRFGGYAEYVLTDARASTKISDKPNVAEATALATQCCTAYYCAEEMVRLFAGDKVLIHSAAGGVGSALLQLAKHRGCEIFATTGSRAKIDLLKKNGAAHVLNTAEQPFDEAIKELTGGRGVEVIFDAVGGSFIRKGIRSLAAGGRIVCYGAADLTDAKTIFSTAWKALQFGIYHPALFMTASKSLIGVNMLRIADHKPEVLQRCLANVTQLYDEEILRPVTGKIFPATDIVQAHNYLEGRKSVGKVACQW